MPLWILQAMQINPEPKRPRYAFTLSVYFICSFPLLFCLLLCNTSSVFWVFLYSGVYFLSFSFNHTLNQYEKCALILSKVLKRCKHFLSLTLCSSLLILKIWQFYLNTENKLLHFTKLSSLWSPKLFSSYLILPLV